MLDGLIAFFVAGGWVVVPVWYLVLSLVAYFAYAIDKSAAIRGDWRIRESTLHTFEVLGGWPGALAAQRILRHKNRKVSYRAMFNVMIVLNLSALIYVGYRLSIAESPVEWRPSRIAARFASSRNECGRPNVPAVPKKDGMTKGSVSIRISR